MAGEACAQPHQSIDAAAALSSGITDFAPPRGAHDTLRKRIWAVNNSGVMLYDERTWTLIASLPLPGWAYAFDQHGCAPGLLLDWAGNAMVSSTGAAALWRIDAQSLEAERIDMALPAGADKRSGFTGLFYVSRQVLLALSALDGALWRIDLDTRRATPLEMVMPITGACALQFVPAIDVNPYRIDELGENLLRLCASSRDGAHQIEVTGLARVNRIDASCPDD